jgi:FkbM family methyltransferase
MEPFSENLRYEYDLNMDSVVWDVGGHQGDFARNIIQRYGCSVVCFEPMYQFQQAIRNQNMPGLTLIPCALGKSTYLSTFWLQGDLSGAFASGTPETVAVLDVASILRGAGKIDLLKLNCEGMEYDILERVLDTFLERQLCNIQVQFHTVAANAEQRRIDIRHALSDTHKLTYEHKLTCEEPFIWENWQLV